MSLSAALPQATVTSSTTVPQTLVCCAHIEGCHAKLVRIIQDSRQLPHWASSREHLTELCREGKPFIWFDSGRNQRVIGFEITLPEGATVLFPLEHRETLVTLTWVKDQKPDWFKAYVVPLLKDQHC